MQPVSQPAEDGRTYFLLLMATLIALAWLALAVWGQSPYGRFLSHEHSDNGTKTLAVWISQ